MLVVVLVIHLLKGPHLLDLVLLEALVIGDGALVCLGWTTDLGLLIVFG